MLVEYTQQQCDLYGVPVQTYSGPSLWDRSKRNWVSKYVNLPYIDDSPVILVPKYIVRRKLSLDSQEFYNKQITDYLVAENLRAGSSLVQVIKGVRKVFKGDVREENPKSKPYIAEMALAHPELLASYKEIAKRHKSMISFDNEDLSINTISESLIDIFDEIDSGAKAADEYHRFIMGVLTILFYPDLTQPHKEWEIYDGRKRVDIVYTNAADTEFFAQRRNDSLLNANTVIVECKNYLSAIANPEIDQLLGRFDNNRGKFGIIACRKIDDHSLLMKRLRDASSRQKGYIICLTDQDFKTMLLAKSKLQYREIYDTLRLKYRALLE
ncbi:hypothetical protein MKK64_03140 [Methylobacterium sp. E-025]|uniref:hypothetical protein n=1 Tax=Methylobacterium sp. E-025 TaxID=2836561 RepID=UPI001FBA04A4|nr:hypothetical protein [Methylobacterium sp. E-025]MCJ2110216.1 hypothetical protein [Methylobacterium sp. E-025]